MDETVQRLKTPEECERFIKNVQAKYPDLEREALEAVYAYEEVLSAKRGRRQPASRTWPMIRRLGIIPAMEKLVARKKEAAGYTTLVEMGMQDLAFEAVVPRHPESFSADAVAQSRKRMKEWNDSEV